ncbi:nickel ABC transporter ATP-binding protein NikE [Paenibacillus apiarius]|uniref:nickel ABC transporter ATP-binding protein NikE n=1 Tax=Paenibacillus apiarius TaxID=46240 RepID=UPI0019825BDA|nr:ABC transporter ATP-binding protein [Paenibacillus apiarius]MBN3522597.1 ABC transporter ATP-binding protein [Paenibacillus apiarius]
MSAEIDLLRVNELSLSCGGVLRRDVLKQLSFALSRGKVTALIGESGSGKSMTAQALLGLLPPEAHVRSGAILFEGEDIRMWPERRLQLYRGGQVGIVFQDTFGTFDPLYRVGSHFQELYAVHARLSKSEAKERALQLLGEMQFPDPDRVYRAYPHELSGGMRQRVQLALAIAPNPQLLIADEPTTALDMSVQADILRLITRWNRRTGASVLFITHDLGVVDEIADEVLVMQQGEIVESGSKQDIMTNPAHPHTANLIADYASLSAPNQAIVADGAVSIVEVRDVSKAFRVHRGWGRAGSKVRAVRNASFRIGDAELVGLIGESGSGKSTLSRLLLRLDDPDSGSICWSGITDPRRSVQWVHQDPLASFDPRWTVGRIVGEALDYACKLTKAESSARVKAALDSVGLSGELADIYPRQLSGGMRQRVALARASIVQPRLLVLDEPFASLDMTQQRQMLSLLRHMNETQGTAMLFITHDVRAAMTLCHRIMVMHQGELVEQLPAASLPHSGHPYTKRLLAAIPGFSQKANE